MRCTNCNTTTTPGDRYCPQCGNYLSARPGTAHRDLLQLSPNDFAEALSVGMPLITENARTLWAEASEFSPLGNRRGVGILNGFAEEEAGKVLLLFDALRTPRAQTDNRARLIRQLDSHVGKGVYVRYYRTSPADMTEVKRIVESERQEFSREGEFGEYVLPNSITTRREERLYVSYIKRDDETHEWVSPCNPSFHFGQLSRFGAIRVVEALHDSGIFQLKALLAVRDYWQPIPFADIGDNPLSDKLEHSIKWPKLTELNHGMLRMLYERDLLSAALTEDIQRVLTHELLFPLYPFDLTMKKNFDELPQPDWPGDYY